MIKQRNGKEKSRVLSVFIEESAGEPLINIQKTNEDMNAILNALNSHFIFSSLNEEDKEIIAKSMQLFAFNAGSYIFKQLMPSKSFLMVSI